MEEVKTGHQFEDRPLFDLAYNGVKAAMEMAVVKHQLELSSFLNIYSNQFSQKLKESKS